MTPWLIRMAKHLLPYPIRSRLRNVYRAMKGASWAVASVEAGDREEAFRRLLCDLGVQPSDAVLVHSSAEAIAQTGISAMTVIRLLEETIQPEGVLLMPSFPFGNDFFGYLRTLQAFDVRRTPSRMGMITEIFRRLPDVRRSLHPTHPVCAKGREADWFVSEHHRDTTPFGVCSPFAKLALRNGLVIGLGVLPENCLTNVHVFEDGIGEQYPFRLYAEEQFQVVLIDHHGESLTFRTPVHNALSGARDIAVLTRALMAHNRIKYRDFFNAPCFGVRARLIDETLEELYRDGMTLYGRYEVAGKATKAEGPQA